MALFDEIPFLYGKGYDYSHMFSIVLAMVIAGCELIILCVIALLSLLTHYLRYLQGLKCKTLSKKQPDQPLLGLS